MNINFVPFRSLFCGLFLILLPVNSSVHAQENPRIDAESLLSHVQILSSDKYEGRLAGSQAGVRTQEYLIDSFSKLGLPGCAGEYRQGFEIRNQNRDGLEGGNILGLIQGTSDEGDIIVLSAHFDHLGIRNGIIYNGADDNASGSAALIEVAAYFLKNPPSHSIIIAAFDAEEGGLQGARAFLENPCVDIDRIAINVNMDMISRSTSSELYVSGTYHYPALKELLSQVKLSAGFNLLYGHDVPGTGSDDWTSASDHGPFYQRGIPHLYFGVEDHAGYHNPDDDFEYITTSFYVDAVELIVDVLIALDENMTDVRLLNKR